MLHVAIIGAGAAGLAVARHVAKYGFGMDVYEMGERIGGTWAYTDEVGMDRYGYPVYSAMYKGLRTNLPKEVMGYPDFPVLPEQDRSYLTQEEILLFLNLYAEEFDLKKHMKFNTMVKDVRPVEGKWQVTSVYKPTGQETVKIYDSVMVCNGHYNDPVIPTLPEQQLFKGKIDHSHNFRDPKRFAGKRVLLIGAGPSGLDLTLQISSVAEHVVLSHHMSEPFKSQYPSNVELKPDVKRILDFDKVEFIDGSSCCFDEIVFCTGYRYSFPFLHESCHVTIDDSHIQPLYKHMIHIDFPTLCFIGVPFNVCTFQMFDLQARYYCEYLQGSMTLPSAEEMRMHTEEDIENRKAKGYTKPQMHMMGPDQQAYYDDLASQANTAPIPSVLVKLRDLSVKRLYEDLLNFRQDRYRIVNDHDFIRLEN